MIRKSSLFCGSALMLAIAACSDTTGVSNLSQAEMNQLAADMDAVATLSPTDFGAGAAFNVIAGGSGSASVSAPTTFTNSFDVTKQCPQGGSVELAGTTSGTADRATHSLSVETTATRTDAACKFNTEHGVVTITGKPNIAYDGKLNIVNAAFSGLQTQTHLGAFSWERGGLSQDCAVDLKSSFDPATHTVTVTGKFCGIDVNVTRTRTS